jgi:hypothetical protein
VDKTRGCDKNRDMIRVKIVKDYRDYRAGQVLELEPNVAFGLVDSGKAIISKDITTEDYSQKVTIKPKKTVEK